MRLLRITAASLLIVILGVGAWAAVYAYDKGFSKKWRRMIMAEFDRRGIEAEIGKLTIDPIEGLVARDVKIFADKRHKSVVASMDNITLDIDFAKLLRKQQFLNTVEFRDADISFPVDPEQPDGDRLEIKNFSARVRLPENKIEIDRAECDFHGVHITLAGSLLQPKTKTGQQDKDTHKEHLELMRQRREILASVVDEIDKFHLDPDAPPHLHVEVIGDLDALESIEATANLKGANLGRGKYYCNALEVRAEYRHPDILIDQIKITDDVGDLYADAHWRFGSDTIPFQVESSINSPALLTELLGADALVDVVFWEPPKLGARGEFYLGEKAKSGSLPLKLTGIFECARFNVSGGQIFDSAYAEFSIDPTRWYVRNLSLDHKTGTAQVNALYDEASGIRYSAEIDMDPAAFSPVIRTEETKEFLSRFEFDKKHPIVSVSIAEEGPSLDSRGWKNHGEFTLGACTYRDVEVLSANGRFDISGKDMIFRDFSILRKEGKIDGDYVHVRGAEKLAEVRNIRSTAYPAKVAAYFAPKTAAFLEKYQFLSPPEVTLNGLIDTGAKFRSDFEATFRTPGPASFQLFKRELAMSAPTGSIEVKGDELAISLKAGLLGGNADYSGTVGIGPRRGNFTGDLTAKSIDFSQLVELYEIPTETHGTLHGNLRFSVPAADPKRWSGTGDARLTEGNVFAIPVMGRMSRLVSGVFDRPQAGFNVATEASASLQIDRGVIRSDDFQALTPGFVLRAKGEIDTIERQLDIDAEMNARGPLRLVGWPISKLLRYKGEGDMYSPEWRPVNFTLPRRGGDGGTAGERPGIGEVVTGIPKAMGTGTKATVDAGGKVLGAGARATVGVGSKALETGSKAIGASAKIIGGGTKGAMDVGSKARDLIPIPRLFPKKEKGEAAPDTLPGTPENEAVTPPENSP